LTSEEQAELDSYIQYWQLARRHAVKRARRFGAFDSIRKPIERRSHLSGPEFPTTYHPAPFQIDHVIARQHGGATGLENQIGRVTIAVLIINDPEVVAMRKALQEEGASNNG
jgi:hypothetical protein